jgi:hypothetical protein
MKNLHKYFAATLFSLSLVACSAKPPATPSPSASASAPASAPASASPSSSNTSSADNSTGDEWHNQCIADFAKDSHGVDITKVSMLCDCLERIETKDANADAKATYQEDPQAAQECAKNLGLEYK